MFSNTFMFCGNTAHNLSKKLSSWESSTALTESYVLSAQMTDNTCNLKPCSAYLAGKEMPADFHKDLVILVWSLVPRYDDLSTRKVLQLIYLEEEEQTN